MSGVTVFACGNPRDHECDDNGPTLYGGDGVPTVTDPSKAGKGYTWGSVSCSICGTTAMDAALWRDDIPVERPTANLSGERHE